MWKILHRLFGWDYIYWENSAASGVARVHVDARGDAYYWRYNYKSTKVLDPIPPMPGTRVRWLTCKPDKYMHW